MTELLLSPVFHKFPRLQVALSEGGIGWMPWMLERIDYVWERHRHYTGCNPDVRPSDLFRDHIFGCFISDDTGIEVRDLDRRRQHHVRERLPALATATGRRAGSSSRRCSPTSPTTRPARSPRTTPGASSTSLATEPPDASMFPDRRAVAQPCCFDRKASTRSVTSGDDNNVLWASRSNSRRATVDARRGVDGDLRQPDRLTRQAREMPREGLHPFDELRCGIDGVHEPDREGLLRIDDLARHRKPPRPVRAHESRQTADAPEPGSTARFATSGRAKVLASDARRKSHDTPSSTPTPKHGPCAASTIGFSICSISSNRS